jgi:hypothetical protein
VRGRHRDPDSRGNETDRRRHAAVGTVHASIQQQRRMTRPGASSIAGWRARLAWLPGGQQTRAAP